MEKVNVDQRKGFSRIQDLLFRSQRIMSTVVRLHKQVYQRLMNIKLEDGRYRNVQKTEARPRPSWPMVDAETELRRTDYCTAVRAGLGREL
jgi:hypothetical protein